MGFIENSTHFYIARFLLGAAEAGFFPGVIVYLRHWFRLRDRAKAVAMFMTAIPVANIFAAPLSGWILGFNWLGWAGWRWVFILEGFPAIILGVVTLFYLTDRPSDAKWLTAEEKAWISGELEKEIKERKKRHGLTILQAMRHRNVVILALAYFCAVTSAYGFNFWLPEIVKKLSGYGNFVSSAISAVPYVAGLIAMLIIGWSSDRTGERRFHTALPLTAVSAGLILSAVFADNLLLAMVFFCLAGAGLYSYLPGFWAIPASFLTESAAAASIGMINSIGNLGGFVGPYAVGYLKTKTGSFYAGIVYLSCSAIAAALLIMLVRHTSEKHLESADKPK
jgi:ACS family tartrate transporter-like MFS transporter